MSNGEQTFYPEVPKAEFKDTPAKIQIIQCGILIAGGLTACLLWTNANHNLMYYCGAGIAVVAAIIAVAVLHYKHGDKAYLQHFDDRLVQSDGDKVHEIPFDKLLAYSGAWTDVYVNGVYSNTTVKMSFDVEGAFRVFQYESAARDGTLKYEQLQALQADVSGVIASRMRETLLEEGSVPWTAQLTLTTAGIEYRKKAAGEPQLIPFPRLGKWEVASGIFKLAFDEDRRPSVKESVSQTNFFPGLYLFAELHEQFSHRDVAATEDQTDSPSEELVEAIG